eukprot:GFYU01008706.1.p1 GENE.GFYU01008706.1~~GFYU01008706.1.p1  ORF type:complete len:327 (-),score=18.67 GFYU01008706.1:175-1155(-)
MGSQRMRPMLWCLLWILWMCVWCSVVVGVEVQSTTGKQMSSFADAVRHFHSSFYDAPYANTHPGSAHSPRALKREVQTHGDQKKAEMSKSKVESLTPKTAGSADKMHVNLRGHKKVIQKSIDPEIQSMEPASILNGSKPPSPPVSAFTAGPQHELPQAAPLSLPTGPPTYPPAATAAAAAAQARGYMLPYANPSLYNPYLSGSVGYNTAGLPYNMLAAATLANNVAQAQGQATQLPQHAPAQMFPVTLQSPTSVQGPMDANPFFKGQQESLPSVETDTMCQLILQGRPANLCFLDCRKLDCGRFYGGNPQKYELCISGCRERCFNE